MCKQHRWNHDGTRCLDAHCQPNLSAAQRERIAREAHLAKLAANKAQKAAEMPVWLRTKPRSPKQVAQAKAYCEMKGIPYPYNEKPTGS